MLQRAFVNDPVMIYYGVGGFYGSLLRVAGTEAYTWGKVG